MTPTPIKQEKIIVRTHRMVVWHGTYEGEDSRYLTLGMVRRITPDILAATEISHFAVNGTSKALPPYVERVWIPLVDVAELIKPSERCNDMVMVAMPSSTRREMELSALHRATDTDVNPYQSTFGT